MIDKKQGDISLSGIKPFLKIVNDDLSFADKTQNFDLIDDADPEKILISYKVPETVTRQENVYMQLLFQTTQNDDTIVWQTEWFNVTFEESLDVTETIVHDYPDVLQDLETRVGSLEGKAVSITECIDRAHFPDVGEENVVYIDAADNMPYRYDTARQTYSPIGLTADDIKIINANGGI